MLNSTTFYEIYDAHIITISPLRALQACETAEACVIGGDA